MATSNWLEATLDYYPGTSAWHREIQRVLQLAAAHRQVLDTEMLVYSDVRDLQALRLRLERTSTQDGSRFGRGILTRK